MVSRSSLSTYYAHPLIVRELPEIRSFDKVMRVEEKNKQGESYGTGINEDVAGIGGSLRSSDEQVEPKDEDLYIRGKKWHIHHRSSTDGADV
jgi:hypothetical protein